LQPGQADKTSPSVFLSKLRKNTVLCNIS
jgi:hypothetical protein